MSKKKIVLFGCGRFGSSHIKEIGRRDDAEVVALVDTTASKRQRLIESGNLVNPPYEFADPESFFKAGMDYDAGLVVTPPRFLYEISSALLQDGKHAYVEKPFATCVEDAENLVRLADENNLVLMVGANRCVYPAYRAAANAVRNGEIGNTEMIHLYYRRRFPFWTEEKRTWRDDPSAPGSGLLFDQGSHFNLYLFNSLGFEPAKAALLNTELGESGVDIADTYILTDVDGRAASVFLDGTYRGDDRTEIIKIYGSSGAIEVRFEGNGSSAYLSKEKKETRLDKSEAIEEVRRLGIEYTEAHPALVHNFVSQLTGATQINASPGSYGALSVRTIDALNKSRNTNGRVYNIFP